jgi:hypothetical protein
MEAAITTIFANVPNPGFWRSGIQSSSTTTETKNVDSPIFKFEFNEIPSESTTQGEFPNDVTTRKASPTPNIINPKIKTSMR